MGRALLFSAIFWTFLEVELALAGGLFLPDRGVYPLSRGGACIASCPPLHSIWYNPANLAGADKFLVTADLGLIFNNLRFQRASRMGETGQLVNYQYVENEAPPAPIPTLLVGYGWKKLGLAVGGGFYAPYASFFQFPDTGPQRYSLVSLTGSLMAVAHLAAAWSPHPRFRIGAGIQNYFISLKLVSAISNYIGIFGAPEDPDLDLYSQVELNAPINISGNVGLWGRVIQSDDFTLDLAVSVQFPTAITARGNFTVRLPTHPLFDPVKIDGSRVRSSFSLPLIFRSGLAFQIGKRADVELAFVFENWSVHDKLSILPDETGGIWLRNVPTIGDFKMPTITIPRNFKDTFSIRAGTQIVAVPQFLSFRVGYIFETGAMPDEMKSVLFYDSQKHLMALGSTFQYRNWSFDILYAIAIFPESVVESSSVKQINPLNPEGALTVGAGIYNSTVHIFGLSVRTKF